MGVFIWITCFVIGVALFISGIAFFWRKEKNKKNTIIASLIEFAACSVMLFPAVYVEIPESGFAVIESVFTSILITFTRYLGNGYDHIKCPDILSPFFFSVYSTVIVLINLLMLVFAVDFVLQLAKAPYQLIRLRLNCRKTLFIMSECNEKTIAIAKSIKCTEDFCVVFSVINDLKMSDYYNSVEEMGAIVIYRDLYTILHKVVSKANRIELFLFNEKEELNLQQLGELNVDELVDNEVKVFVEVNRTHWSLYDDYIIDKTSNHKKLTINLVRTEENFVYNELLAKSIFKNAYDNGSVKQINILIIGYNYRSLEFLKAVLHLGQMPGYELNITLIENGDHKRNIKHIMPAIAERGGGFGDSVYTFKHLTGIGYDSSDFDILIKSLVKEVTYAFVNAGDDLLNSEIAMGLNIEKYRDAISRDIDILVNVSANSACYKGKWNEKLTNGVDFVGEISQVYNYSFITMSKLEIASESFHNHRQKVKQQEAERKNKNHEIESWEKYCNDEYNRHSVYARTLSLVYKVDILKKNNMDYSTLDTDNEWIVYEHMRWNIYMRTLGYIKAPEVMLGENKKVLRDIRNAAKVHHCLVPFDKLINNDPEKDKLALTPDIINDFENALSEQPAY